MANRDQLAILKQGVEVWNEWREEEPRVEVDLSEADLSWGSFDCVDFRHANLTGAKFVASSLRKAFLTNADATYANFTGADLRECDLQSASLVSADMHSFKLGKILEKDKISEENFNNHPIIAKFRARGFGLIGSHLYAEAKGAANFEHANLSQTTLFGSDFTWADLRKANFTKAELSHTNFTDAGLSDAIGLEDCIHRNPSIISFETLRRSGSLPSIFLRGCGLSDTLIDYVPSLIGEAFQFYTCFISYSTKDQEFADRLHADLQNAGVRCWFAPHDLPIGAKTWDGIDEAIRTRDKVLLILSEGAIASDWVEDEITTAFAEERRRKELVLFPVRLDDSVMDSVEPWAGKLRDNRNIGDFTKWKEHDAYKATFERVLRDLRAKR